MQSTKLRASESRNPALAPLHEVFAISKTASTGYSISASWSRYAFRTRSDNAFRMVCAVAGSKCWIGCDYCTVNPSALSRSAGRRSPRSDGCFRLLRSRRSTLNRLRFGVGIRLKTSDLFLRQRSLHLLFDVCEQLVFVDTH